MRSPEPSDRERAFFGLLRRGMGLGALLGALSGLLDSGPVFWILAASRPERGSFLTALGWDVVGAPLTMPIGAIVGFVIGSVAGTVAGIYASVARESRGADEVARGIRACILGVILAFTAATFLVASGSSAGRDPNQLAAVVLIPGCTALALGWIGARRISRAYVRLETRQQVEA